MIGKSDNGDDDDAYYGEILISTTSESCIFDWHIWEILSEQKKKRRFFVLLFHPVFPFFAVKVYFIMIEFLCTAHLYIIRLNLKLETHIRVKSSVV